MTKSDKVKLGVAGGLFLIAALILFYMYGMNKGPEPTKLEPADPGIAKPNVGTPGPRKK